jgi:hypothetical protein
VGRGKWTLITLPSPAFMAEFLHLPDPRGPRRRYCARDLRNELANNWPIIIGNEAANLSHYRFAELFRKGHRPTGVKIFLRKILTEHST